MSNCNPGRTWTVMRVWLCSRTHESYVWSCVVHRISCTSTKRVRMDSKVNLILRLCSHWNQKLEEYLYSVSQIMQAFSQFQSVLCLLCSLRNEDGNFVSKKLSSPNPCDFIASTWIYQIIFLLAADLLFAVPDSKTLEMVVPFAAFTGGLSQSIFHSIA